MIEKMKMGDDIYTKQIKKDLKQFRLKSDEDKLKYMTKNLELLNFSIDNLHTQADILDKKIEHFKAIKLNLQEIIDLEDFTTFEKEFFKI